MRTPKVNLPENFVFQPDLSKKNGEAIIRETREYELITPLFGGGVETKKADEISVIRATEIRGHLRFWWRATRGGQFSTIEELKKHEDAIFGSTERNSALQIEVVLDVDYEKRKENNDKITRIAYKKGKRPDGKPKIEASEVVRDFQYVAFPLQPESGDPIGWMSEICVSVKLKLAISYPKEFKIYKKDGEGNIKVEKKFDSSIEIQSALWAWGIFGGIGARTRRGFGALKLSKKNEVPQADEIFVSQEKLREQAGEYIYGGKAPKGVSYLNKNLRFVVIDRNIGATEIWKELVGQYKDFRQQRKTKPKTDFNGKVVKDSNGNIVYVPCRSEWNEPEYIRELTNQRLLKHGKIARLQIEKFPRAAFGMPIEFKFKRDDTWEKDRRNINPDASNVDPRKTSLTPTGFERFASPLILRPIACANNKAVGIALLLENEQEIDEIGLTLESRDNPKGAISSGFKSKLDGLTKEHQKIKAIDGSNLLGNEIDVLQAFLNYLGR
jgi:CRISPR-associated protein Cmr1